MFDPYHKWLGIPREEQPPNHYRLLGLSLFESDPDVIDAAANRQMAYLQGCATGTQALLSQRLLNEVAAARLCLLNLEKKATYDARLRAKRSSAPKEGVRDRGRARGAFDDIFADGKEPDRSLKSKVLMDADEAAEIQATASGYRPEIEQLRRPSRDSRSIKARRSLLFVSLTGIMFVAVVGYLASRAVQREEAGLRGKDLVAQGDKSGIVRREDVRNRSEDQGRRPITKNTEVGSGEKKQDDRKPIKRADEQPPTIATVVIPKSAVVPEVSPLPKTTEHPLQRPSEKPALLVKPTRIYPENRFIRLFNERNFDGWHGYFAEWRIDPRRGVLISPGAPPLHGTGPDRTFDNFVLRFGYRVLSKTNGLFSGLVVRHGDQGVSIVIGDGNSGDLVFRKWIDDPDKSLNQTKLASDFNGFNTLVKTLDRVEKPLGDWNSCQIVCDKSEITISINGLVVNQVLNAEPGSGKIYFTQNGTKAEYRDIRIMPIRAAASSQPKATGRSR